ncbi:MAG: adenylate/guanylate cyclase domain-containing protein [Agathobacter sp.]|nr:adenylate/guanylate cyclase domain-containing protein [Agathobacter sp.]
MSKKVTLNKIMTICCSIILAILTFILSYSQALEVPDEFFSNYFYTYNPLEKADERITIIAIDSDSEEKYGKYSTWSRSLLAEAVDKLTTEKASVIALDTDLSATKDSDGDARLVKACEKHGAVATMANAHFDSKDNPQGDSEPSDMNDMTLTKPADSSMNWKEHSVTGVSYPYDELKSVTKTGISNAVQQGLDNSIHFAALNVSVGHAEIQSSFAAVTYMLYKDSRGEEYDFPHMDTQNLFGFNNIYDTKSYQIISFKDLLSGDYDSGFLENNIVIIGEYKQGEKANRFFDFNYFKSDSAKQEVLVQSAIIQALITNKTIHNVSIELQALAFAILAAILYLFCSKRRTFWAFIVYFLSILVFGLFSYILYLQGYRIRMLVPAIMLLVSSLIYLLQKLIMASLEQYRMKRTLNLYVDSQVVNMIEQTNPFELSQLNERRNIAVLFVDIRGFTALSELLEPENVVEFLNQYFTVVYSAIEAWNGTLDKFIGDAAMAIFNAPSDLEDYEFNAVCAADDIIKGFEKIKQVFFEKYNREIDIGIGIDCGDAVVGNIGCLGRMDYTAIGDVVNTASRLESKARPGQILISNSMYEKIGQRCEASTIGNLSLKGKKQTVTTYEINRIDKPHAPNAIGRKEFLRESTLLYSKFKSNIKLP